MFFTKAMDIENKPPKMVIKIHIIALFGADFSSGTTGGSITDKR